VRSAPEQCRCTLDSIPCPTRRPSGYREYSPEMVALVRFIKRAQHLGFSLQDVGELLELRRNPSRSRVAVRAVAVRRVADIADRIRRTELRHHEPRKALIGRRQAASTIRFRRIAGGLGSALAAPSVSLVGV
jgi:DNA-binding transcriptional MerR regulator